MQFKFRLPIVATLIGTLLFGAAACAQGYRIGDIHVADPQARATAPGQPAGAVYLSMENRGAAADSLIAASSPAAKAVEIHTMSMQGNVMRMRQVPGIPLAPAQKIAMTPGHGYHIMLIGLTQPLKLGDRFPLTLSFEQSGALEVSVQVVDTGAIGKAAHRDAPAHPGH